MLDRLLDILSSALSLFSSDDPTYNSRASHNPQDNTNPNTEICKDSTFRPLSVVIERSPPPSIERETREINHDRRDQERTDRDRTRLTIETICAGASILAIALTLGTLFVAKRSADAAKVSAEAANASVKAAEKATWLSDRAWLSITAPQERVNLTVGKPIFFPIQVENTGVTPATKFFGKVKLRVLRRGEEPDISQHSYGTGLQIPVLVGHFRKTIPIPATDGQTGKEVIFTPDRARGITDTSLFMVIWGRLEYVDYRKVAHWIQFCQTLGPDPPQVPTCSDYNQIDEDEPK